MREVVERLEKILKDRELREQVKRVASESADKIWVLLDQFSHVVKWADEVRRVKESVIRDLDRYVKLAMSSIERIGGRAYLAENAEEARRIIRDIVGSDKIIVKAKSMATEEIELNRYLEELGKEVIETDLGMFLIQVLEDLPSHPVAPAIHLTRERIIRGLRKKKIEVSETASPEEIAGAVREYLRKKIFSADVGISGANALAADTGAIVLVENESNIRLVTSIPKKHIALVPIDKIAPTLEDAIKIALVQAAYDGLYPPTYLSVIAGPSSTADIEHKRILGAQGPKELHVVLLDNGRSRISRDSVLSEILKCVRCGRCVFECPVYEAIGPGYGFKGFNGPMGVVWLYVIGEVEAAGHLSMLCTHAGNCREVCPVKIDLPKLISRIKSEYAKKLLSS